MYNKELKFILKEREGQFIEFKEFFDTKNLSKEIVAFANASGGKIYLGIADNAKITGIKITNKLKSQIQDIANNCDPSIIIIFEEFKNILIIEIKEGKNKPYSCSFGFYMRVGPNSQKMKRDEILKLAIKGGKIRFDEQICKDFDFKDFDNEKFEYYLKLSKISNNLNKKDILQNLKVLTNDGMTNAGVLFFAKEPYKYIGNSRLRCARFKGNKRVDIIDKKEVDKGIIGNIEFAIQYLNECVPVRFEIIGSRRKEYPQFPEKAYREAIVNAVVHRDYFDNGEVAVEKFQNSLVINNPGGSLVSEKEFGVISRLRNRLIADLLSRTVFMERVGTGIKRVKDVCFENKNEVEFILGKNNFFIIIKSAIISEGVNGGVNDGVNGGVNDGVNSLFNYIKNNPGKRVIYFEKELNITRRTIERWLKKLKDDDIIEFRGSSKTGGYFIKKIK